MRRPAAWLAPALLLLLLSAGPALAHPPPLGLTGFTGGVLHPLFVPAHALALLALGLLIGQQAPRWGRAVAACAVAALLAGLGLIALAFVPRYAGQAVLALAALTGLLVAWARPLPEPLGCALGAATTFAIALDSPPEVISLREANIMLIGTAFGVAVLVAVVAKCASHLKRPWQRVALRVLGSWSAASAMLVLALQFGR